MLPVYIHSNLKGKGRLWGECFNVKDGEEGTAIKMMTRGRNKKGGEARTGVMDEMTKQMTERHAWTVSLDIPHLATFWDMYSFSLSEKTISFSSHCFYSYILAPFLSLLLPPSHTVTSSLTTFLSFLHPPYNATTLPTITFFSHSFLCPPRYHSSTFSFIQLTLQQLRSYDN
jgi:hypothetical protein